MKTYINILIIFTYFTIYSQEIIVPLEQQLTYQNNTDTPIYFKDVNNILNKFIGNWISDDGTHYLKLIITKETHQPMGFLRYNNPNFEDELVIKLIYKINNTEIYNTTPTPPQNPLISGNWIKNSNKVQLHYYEPTQSCERQKSANLTLEFVSDGTIIQDGELFPNGNLIWNRVNQLSYKSPQKVCPDGSVIDSSDFIIPSNLTLVRE